MTKPQVTRHSWDRIKGSKGGTELNGCMDVVCTEDVC